MRASRRRRRRAGASRRVQRGSPALLRRRARWYRRLALAQRRAAAFWVLLRVGQGSALRCAIAVGSLAAAGKYSSERLFYLYALLPLAVGVRRRAAAGRSPRRRSSTSATSRTPRRWASCPRREQQAVVAEIMRREMGVMALSALVVVFLALRAAGTAHGF